MLQHPPYSLDLAPFETIFIELNGKAAMKVFFDNPPNTHFRDGIYKLEDYSNKCIEVQE